MTLLHMTLLSRRLVEDMAAVLGSVRRLNGPSSACNHATMKVSDLSDETYSVKMKAHRHLVLAGVLNAMQTESVTHIRDLLPTVRRRPPDVQSAGFEFLAACGARVLRAGIERRG